jgi:hypothetical protein
MNTRKESSGSTHKHWATKPQPSTVLFCLLWRLVNEALTKQGEFRALVVREHIINPWH